MAELAYALDLKSSSERIVGSTPTGGTFGRLCTSCPCPEVRTAHSGFDSLSGDHGREAKGQGVKLCGELELRNLPHSTWPHGGMADTVHSKCIAARHPGSSPGGATTCTLSRVF